MAAKRAAAAVLAATPEAAELVERVERLQRELVDAGSALAWLWSERALPEGAVDAARNSLGGMAAEPRAWRFGELIPGAAHWKAAFARLMADPSAPFTL